MKNIPLPLRVYKIILFSFATFFAIESSGQTFNQVTLKNSLGKKVQTDEIYSRTKPILMIFWKMTDQRSCDNLIETIQAVSDSIGLERIDVIAVCGGEPGSFEMAIPWLKSQELDIDFYFDVNDELGRQMGIKAPFTIIFNPNLKMIFKNCSYSFGNEAIVCSILKNYLSDKYE